jgi:hypothetical protein
MVTASRRNHMRLSECSGTKKNELPITARSRASEPHAIVLECFYIAQARPEAAEQIAVQVRSRFSESVVNPKSFLASDHEAVLAQVGQVP